MSKVVYHRSGQQGGGSPSPTPAGMSIETFSGATLTCEADKYYRATEAVNTLAITLPAMTDVSEVKSMVIGLTTGNNPVVTFASADNKTIRYVENYSLEAEKSYEINALYNGLNWTIAYVTIGS